VTTSRARAPRDVVALVFGLLLTCVAAAALWLAVVGSLNWSLLRTAAPIALVVVGVLGLASSRRS
jgi:membrane protein YdbS with pleckstrin-like domain